MDYDEFANMQQALDAIIDSAFTLWEQTDDLDYAIMRTAQRFVIDADQVTALFMQYLVEYGYDVEA